MNSETLSRRGGGSVNPSNGLAHVPPQESEALPLLVDAKRLARLLSVSVATIHRMDESGKLPAPIRLSAGCTRWSRADIEAWIAARCPDRATFEALQTENRESGR